MKLDKLSNEARLLEQYGINTVEELFSYKSKAEKEIKILTENRKQLRNKSKRKNCSNLNEVKEEISEIGKRLKELRKKILLIDDIAERSNEIEEKLGIKAYDIYGLSEIAGPGVGYECECQHGTHLNEDHYFPEIINPSTLEPVAPGETGELVFTHLTKEGMPLLRYRTKDLTALHYDKCTCGRTLVRMDRILGRSDDMLIIRGVNVFPTQIESVILEMPEFEPHYLLIVDRKNNTDTMELQVEVRPEYYSDEINKMLALKKKLAARLQSVLGLGVDVRLVEPRSIERSIGKAKL